MTSRLEDVSSAGHAFTPGDVREKRDPAGSSSAETLSRWAYCYNPEKDHEKKTYHERPNDDPNWKPCTATITTTVPLDAELLPAPQTPPPARSRRSPSPQIRPRRPEDILEDHLRWKRLQQGLPFQGNIHTPTDLNVERELRIQDEQLQEEDKRQQQADYEDHITEVAALAIIPGPYSPEYEPPAPTEEVQTPTDGWYQDATENAKQRLIEDEDHILRKEADKEAMQMDDEDQMPTPSTTRLQRELIESELDAALDAALGHAQAPQEGQGEGKDSPQVHSPAHLRARTNTGAVGRRRAASVLGVRLFGKPTGATTSDDDNDNMQKKKKDKDDE